MSIEQALLVVPAEQRDHFLAQAALLEQRARASGAAHTEYELALAVLVVLCGALAGRESGDPS